MAEVRSELILQKGELGYGVVLNDHHGTRDGAVVVIDAFDSEVVVARALPPDAGAGTYANAAAGCHAWRQQRQVNDARTTGRRGEFHHLLGLEGVLNLRCAGIDGYRAGADLHRLHAPTDLHVNVGSRGHIERDLHTREFYLRKARGRHYDRISPSGQV